jgi:hypothetical protein
MVAADFLQDRRVQGWLDGVEPAWTLLTFESLLALRHEPSTVQSAIQIANDLSVGEIAGSPVARNTLILLGQAIERVGLPNDEGFVHTATIQPDVRLWHRAAYPGCPLSRRVLGVERTCRRHRRTALMTRLGRRPR